MVKVIFPLVVSSISICGTEYTREDDGSFEIEEHHVPEALSAGASMFDENHETGGIDPDAPIPTGPVSGYLVEEAVEGDEGTDAPGDGPDALGDTSGQLEGTVSDQGEGQNGDQGEGQDGDQGEGQVDVLAEALASKPDFDAMSRDEMVDWLASVGIALAQNVSKERARAAIDEAVATHSAQTAQ